MPTWTPVLAYDDIVAGGINKATVGDLKLIVLQSVDGVHIYEDACPHEGYPLSLGEIEGDVITCNKHLWEFDIATGRHISRINRPKCNLKSFQVRVTDGMVEIELPDGGAAA